jgi:ketosteroid isomerase-like protein
MKRFGFTLVIALASFVTAGAQSTPKAIADELLTADRAFAAASAKTDLIAGLSAMFAADVVMPAPTGVLYGRAKAIEALKANPANLGAKAEWTPARVALSGDGRHGFTAGLMTITRTDGSVNPAKYLAYWEKQQDGWRVLVYKRVPSTLKTREVNPTYLLPAQIVAGKSDAAAIERDRDSLADAERAFSRDAQTIGIGPAFKQYGSPEAINVFGGTETNPFTFGNAAIGEQVGSDQQPPNSSSVNWGPEKTIVAASGDFGVTIGYIVRNKPGDDGKIPPGQPFFTIWKRDSPAGKWLYVAE